MFWLSESEAAELERTSLLVLFFSFVERDVEKSAAAPYVTKLVIVVPYQTRTVSIPVWGFCSFHFCHLLR